MIWWFIIPAGIAGALAYAYWEHRKHSRLLTDLFTPLALAHGGEVRAATALALPQLRFELGGRSWFIGAMASGGPLVSGGASRPGMNGPFTFVDVAIPFDPSRELRVQRADKVDRGTKPSIGSTTRGNKPTSGDRVFDSTFRVRSSDRALALRVLDAPVRQKLLSSSRRPLEVVLADGKISVHLDGYVQSADDLDELIEIAAALADNCSDP